MPDDFVPKGEPLSFGIAVLTPISPAPNGPTLFYVQPFITAQVRGSTVLLSGLLFLSALLSKIFRLDTPRFISPEQAQRGDERAVPGEFGDTSADSLIFAITVWSDYSDRGYTPSVLLHIPILALPGTHGALPTLILETLATIIVRTVMPAPLPTDPPPSSDPPPAAGSTVPPSAPRPNRPAFKPPFK